MLFWIFICWCVQTEELQKAHKKLQINICSFFFSKSWKEWKHRKFCNKKHKFREEKSYLNYRHFKTNAHLTARIMWICFEIQQLLTPLKFVELLNKKSNQALWKFCFHSSSLMYLFLWCCSFQESKPTVWKLSLREQFFIFSRTLQMNHNERKNWKLIIQ